MKRPPIGSTLDRLEQRLQTIESKLDQRLDALEAKSVCSVGLLEFWLVDKVEEIDRCCHRRAEQLEQTLGKQITDLNGNVAEHHEQMVDAVRRLPRRVVVPSGD